MGPRASSQHSEAVLSGECGLGAIITKPRLRLGLCLPVLWRLLRRRPRLATMAARPLSDKLQSCRCKQALPTLAWHRGAAFLLAEAEKKVLAVPIPCFQIESSGQIFHS